MHVCCYPFVSLVPKKKHIKIRRLLIPPSQAIVHQRLFPYHEDQGVGREKKRKNLVEMIVKMVVQKLIKTGKKELW
jgi:hypothetical protein